MTKLSNFEVVLAVTQVWLAMGVFCTCFCRLTKTDKHTLDTVVLSFWAMSVIALLLAGAPFLPLLSPDDCHWQVGTTPAWVYLLFMAGALGVQTTTAVHWRQGVPTIFLRR